jgi:CheY-like chemotaxis protein
MQGIAFGSMATTRVKMDNRKKKILIVDDEPEFTDLLTSALDLHTDYEVRVLHDPHQALDTARTFSPDIVILDVVMPELDGGEVHARFKADPDLKAIPIIFLTSIVQQKGVIDGSFYVAKPVSARKLVSVISEHLGA